MMKWGSRVVIVFTGWCQARFLLTACVFPLNERDIFGITSPVAHECADPTFSVPHLFLFIGSKCSTQTEEFPFVKTLWKKKEHVHGLHGWLETNPSLWHVFCELGERLQPCFLLWPSMLWGVQVSHIYPLWCINSVRAASVSSAGSHF